MLSFIYVISLNSVPDVTQFFFRPLTLNFFRSPAEPLHHTIVLLAIFRAALRRVPRNFSLSILCRSTTSLFSRSTCFAVLVCLAINIRPSFLGTLNFYTFTPPKTWPQLPIHHPNKTLQLKLPPSTSALPRTSARRDFRTVATFR